MKNKVIKTFKLIFLLLIFTFITSISRAELNFDFGLPIFGKQEVKFEQTKSADFNFSLLKKYIHDKQDDIISQLHIINRWFSLIKLSDTPRHDELLKLGYEYFDTTNKECTKSEKLLDVFYKGIALCIDKEKDPENKKDEEFENFLLSSEEKLSDDPNYWIIKGILFQTLKERPNNYFSQMKPEEDFKHALSIMPKTAHYYYILGQAFRFINSNDSPLFLAIAAYEKASSLAPKNTKLQTSLLSIYMGLHEEMKASGKQEPFWLEEAVYKKILDISPTNSHAMNNLGYLYAEYGVNLDQAMELCKRAVSITPNNAGFRDSLGWVAFKCKNYSLAESELTKAIKMRENFYDGYYHLATVYYATGNMKGAADNYEKALEIKSDSAEALNNLAYLYAEQDLNTQKSIELAEKAIEIEPNNASYLDTLGWAHYRAKNYSKALEAIKKADELAPGQGEILLHLGRIYLDINNYTESMRYLKEAFRIEPDLKDPDDSMYLAVQLHAQITALSNYHNIMGKNADKNKLQKILNSIVQLYQDEGLYEKSIEISKVSAKLKSGELDLSNPILPGYSLMEKGKIERPEIKPETIIPESIDTSNKVDKKQSSKAEQTQEKNPLKLGKKVPNPEKNLGELPVDIGQSFILSLGPAFFEHIKTIFTFAEHFTDKKITIFIGNIIKPHTTSALKITSEKTAGTSMLRALDGYIKVLGYKRNSDINSDKYEYTLWDKKIYTAALDNSLYVAFVPLKGDMAPEEYSQIILYNKDTFIDAYINWININNGLPSWLKLFATNPIRPFKKLFVKYSIQNGILNEFITATTGKYEKKNYINFLARRLLSLKLAKYHKGLDLNIKLSSYKERVYISIDYNNGKSWIQKKFKRELNRFNPLLVSFFEYKLQSAVCLINRMLGSTSINSCPAGGKTKIDAKLGVSLCNHHLYSPVIPIILDEDRACKLSRDRIYEIMKKQIHQYFEGKPNNEEKQNLINDLKENTNNLLHYYCPEINEWEIDKDCIKCPFHKN